MYPGAGRCEPPKAVIFDLDNVLIDSRRAWQYALEESVAVACGRRIDARPLTGEYHRRPWIHALSVIIPDVAEREQCEKLCIEISKRSALKKLLVHEGMGMALDAVRAARFEVGAMSREPHAQALKEAQSTGLDRFLSVLAATPVGAPYDAEASLARCLAFIERKAAQCVVVSAEAGDRRAASAAGCPVLHPAWAGEPPAGVAVIERPALILASLLRQAPETGGR